MEARSGWESDEAVDEAEAYGEAEPWGAEAYDEAEPWEAEADDEALDEAYEPEFLEPVALAGGVGLAGGAVGGALLARELERRRRGRRDAVGAKGVQTAIVNTPAGNAKIQLPSKVPTLTEFRGTLDRVQRDMAATNRRIASLGAELQRTRRRAARAERASASGARNGLLILALDQVKDVLHDVSALGGTSETSG